MTKTFELTNGEPETSYTRYYKLMVAFVS